METKTPASEAIKDHFDVIGVVPGEVRLSTGEIVDLGNISLEKAKELHENGFPYLKAKKQKNEDKLDPKKDSETKPGLKS